MNTGGSSSAPSSSSSSSSASSSTCSSSSSSSTPAATPLPPPRHRNRPTKRTRDGCYTCKRRRIKCDEGKPSCLNCTKTNRECEGYRPKFEFRDGLNNRYRSSSTSAVSTVAPAALDMPPAATGAPLAMPNASMPQLAASYSTNHHRLAHHHHHDSLATLRPQEHPSQYPSAPYPSVQPARPHSGLFSSHGHHQADQQQHWQRESPLPPLPSFASRRSSPHNPDHSSPRNYVADRWYYGDSHRDGYPEYGTPDQFQRAGGASTVPLPPIQDGLAQQRQPQYFEHSSRLPPLDLRRSHAEYAPGAGSNRHLSHLPVPAAIPISGSHSRSRSPSLANILNTPPASTLSSSSSPAYTTASSPSLAAASSSSNPYYPDRLHASSSSPAYAPLQSSGGSGDHDYYKGHYTPQYHRYS